MTHLAARPARRTSKGPRRPRGDVESSRHLIVAAAAREFAARGFAATTVDRIAAAARLNKAMIYYHFGSKAGLYAEILRDMFGAVGARVREVTASGAPPGQQIQRFVEAIATEAEARPHFPPIWFREIADGGAHLDPQTLREIAAVVGAVAGIVQAGVRDGEFQPVNPLLVHGGIVAPLLLFFASRPLRERIARAGIADAARFERADVVGHIQRVTLEVLRGGPAARPASPEPPAARREGRSRR